MAIDLRHHGGAVQRVAGGAAGARQVKVPQPGTIAPDFELDVVTRQRKVTGERVRLSALRGEPVGLVFGSYT